MNNKILSRFGFKYRLRLMKSSFISNERLFWSLLAEMFSLRFRLARSKFIIFLLDLSHFFFPLIRFFYLLPCRLSYARLKTEIFFFKVRNRLFGFNPFEEERPRSAQRGNK